MNKVQTGGKIVQMFSEQQTLLDVLVRESRYRLCAIVYGSAERGYSIGTGTLLRHSSELLVLTCAHVASEFLRAREAWLNFFKSESESIEIRRSSVDVTYRDSDADTALLRLSTSSQLQHHHPMRAADIANRTEFYEARRATAAVPRYAVCGFPGALAGQVTSALIRMRLLAYGTFPVGPHAPHKLYLSYREDESGSVPTPAPGLSGALIWDLRNAAPGELWAPGKAIAMQSAWREGNYLVARPLADVRKWLRSTLGQ